MLLYISYTAIQHAHCMLDTQGYKHLLLFHYNNGCTNAPQYYVIRTLPVLFNYTDNYLLSSAQHSIWNSDIDAQYNTNENNNN